jgi:nickel/cobalt transporter (NicO) family protein
MIEVLAGSIILSLIHAAVPNHWVPLIAVGKTQGWTKKEVLTATLITGFSHTLSTVLIGVIVGFMGVGLAKYYDAIIKYAAPGILIGLGIIYIVIDFVSKGQSHSHAIAIEKAERKGANSKWAVLFSLSLAMFLTPCIEIEAYYFQAGTKGWSGIFLVSAVYVATTVMVMLVLVYAGTTGMQKIKSHILEHHEKMITGIVLVLLGILAFFT